MLTIIFADGLKFKVGSTQSISRKLSAESTNYRVEKGADISDHIENAPLTLDFSCVFGNAPLNATGAGGQNLPGEHTDFDERMVSAMESKELITLDSEGRDIWENMQVSDYSITADNTTGYGIPFTLSVKEVRYADTKIGAKVPEVAADRPTSRRFAPASGSTGSVTPVPASTNQIALAGEI
jgi:hypothetical protein